MLRVKPRPNFGRGVRKERMIRIADAEFSKHLAKLEKKT